MFNPLKRRFSDRIPLGSMIRPVAILTLFMFGGAAISGQDARDASEDEQEAIDVETDVMQRYSRYCSETFEVYSKEVGSRAQREVDRASSTLRRRFRRGGNLFVIVQSSRRLAENEVELTLEQVPGIEEEIQGRHYFGAKFVVEVDEELGEIPNGAMLEIEGKPYYFASESTDNVVYLYNQMERDRTEVVIRTELENRAAVVLLIENAQVKRIVDSPEDR